MKHAFWTMCYSPFVMGGDCWSAIIAEVECSEEVDLGRGIKGRVAVSPLDFKVYICESETGAIIGNEMTAVLEDIRVADEAVMAKQMEVENRLKNSKKKIKMVDFYFFNTLEG